MLYGTIHNLKRKKAYLPSLLKASGTDQTHVFSCQLQSTCTSTQPGVRDKHHSSQGIFEYPHQVDIHRTVLHASHNYISKQICVKVQWQHLHIWYDMHTPFLESAGYCQVVVRQLIVSYNYIQNFGPWGPSEIQNGVSYCYTDAVFKLVIHKDAEIWPHSFMETGLLQLPG